MKTGNTLVDFEHDRAITSVVTVWITCATHPCSEEAPLLSVMGKHVAGAPLPIAPITIAEINSDDGVSVKKVEYVTESECPGHFEITLHGPDGKRERILRLWPVLGLESSACRASYANESKAG